MIYSSANINTLGLVFDIVGAFFVSTEVIKQYHHNKYVPPITWIELLSPQKESEEYKIWEKDKYLRMRIGLYFLTGGFLLQILSNYV
jgi:hypothetical protein